jgi:hypothetical protein
MIHMTAYDRAPELALAELPCVDAAASDGAVQRARDELAGATHEITGGTARG